MESQQGVWQAQAQGASHTHYAALHSRDLCQWHCQGHSPPSQPPTDPLLAPGFQGGARSRHGAPGGRGRAGRCRARSPRRHPGAKVWERGVLWHAPCASAVLFRILCYAWPYRYVAYSDTYCSMQRAELGGTAIAGMPRRAVVHSHSHTRDGKTEVAKRRALGWWSCMHKSTGKGA